MGTLSLNSENIMNLKNQLKHLESSYQKYNDINSKTKTITNQRKILYRQDDLTTLKLYRFILYLLYYILLPILFIIFLNGKGFLTNQLYKKYKVMIPILILIGCYIIVAIPYTFQKCIKYVYKAIINIAHIIKYLIL